MPVRIQAAKGEGEERRNSKQYRSIAQISAELGMQLCRIQNKKWRHYIRKYSKSMAKLQVLCSELYLSRWGGGADRQLQLLPPSSLPATTSQFTIAPLASVQIPSLSKNSYGIFLHYMSQRKKKRKNKKSSYRSFSKGTQNPQLTALK